MVTFKWCRAEVPTELKVRQVYGVIFDDSGKILLRVDNGLYKLTGGKPEENDNDFIDTLKREYLEELNIELDDIYYLGYLLVENDETVNYEKYAQVRMIGKIKNIGKSKPDSDNGKVYGRFLSNKENIKKYLNYSDTAGNQLIDDAIKMAYEKYKFIIDNNEYYL